MTDCDKVGDYGRNRDRTQRHEADLPPYRRPAPGTGPSVADLERALHVNGRAPAAPDPRPGSTRR